ncbi:acyl-CoA dehydrogenase [Pseudoxanthomonas gei]|uniref:Acyl-CoA dehydrogenase n=1 Tax=Pseudoxanthomonas gei TaxID=1383030 RepID=A0ABX0AD26_9GAMM|nr:acyl-CoA dehydrogenase family protein [Pseudoxanthomonas gei]NDK38146.1 acyl-CoA dehydrogenase [Pseudoxanthomonas gei]
MDFAFNDEQQMLLDTTRRFIAGRYSFEQRNQVLGSADGWSREVWAQLADLGLLAINIPEEQGGIGAGPLGTMLVGNAIGEGLLLEPFWSSAVVATHAIGTLASSAQRAALLPALASGESIAVLAHDEAGTRFDAMNVEMTAVARGDGWELQGRKCAVYHASAANVLLVSAKVGSELGVFMVPSDATGMQLSAFTTVDGQAAADVAFDQVMLGAEARLGGDAHETLPAVLDYALAALCAEAFGAMDRILAATIAYSRARVQFGAPIGSFQALQHRMADMFMHLEQARSMSYLAASQCLNPDAQARGQALSAAKALMGQAARFIGQQSVQLHGGMGMTDELDVSHYFKRLLAFELRCGSSDQHLENYRSGLRAA